MSPQKIQTWIGNNTPTSEPRLPKSIKATWTAREVFHEVEADRIHERAEEILEEERSKLETAKKALVAERLGMKKALDEIRELARTDVNAAAAAADAAVLGTTGQGPRPVEVQNFADYGPVEGAMLTAMP